jgi:hypothetical protein
MDDFGLLVGRHFTTLPTLSDEQLSELQLDSSGRLILSGRYLEDSAHTSGHAGLFVMAVRNDSDAVLTDADGDYSALSVDSAGRLKVLADLDVDFDYVYDEDTAHTDGDSGAYVLAVRQDTLASSTTATGDYASFKVNALGELYVHDTDVKAELVTANSTLSAIDTSLNNIETEITALSQLEDSAHSSGDTGIMALGVRNDTNATLTSADGDYSPMAVDSAGRLKTTATVALDGAEQYTVTDALAAGGDGVETITASGTPWVTVASFSHTSGTAYIYGWQWACDQNADARLITDDTTDIVVYKRSLNSSAMPTYQEHWDVNGRVEIAGAASMAIKLQVKKRSATGGNANGTGSIHLRK